jgi:hypothetical protein
MIGRIWSVSRLALVSLLCCTVATSVSAQPEEGPVPVSQGTPDLSGTWYKALRGTDGGRPVRSATEAVSFAGLSAPGALPAGAQRRDPEPPGGFPPGYLDDLTPMLPGKTVEDVNYRNPNSPLLQRWAQAVMKATNDALMAGIPADAGCRPPSLARLLRSSTYQIVQTPTEIIFLYANNARWRIVHLNKSHPAKLDYSFLGHSVGHWEGDTLVVDTIGLKSNPGGGNYGSPTTESLHVIEHLRLFNDGKAIENRIHMDDPHAFTKPWRALLTTRRIMPLPAVEESFCEDPASGASPFGQ